MLLLLIIKIALALVVGFCFSYYIVASWLYTSNDYGDTSGNVHDFDRGSWTIEERDYKPPFTMKDWENDLENIEQIAGTELKNY